MYATTTFIATLRDAINEIVPTYYEEAPSKNAVFPFAVITGLNIRDLDQGDEAAFYLELWADEKAPDATVTLETLCDTLRNRLTNAVIGEAGTFAAHIGFERQRTIQDNEFDIAHRRLELSARIFYN